MTDPSDWPGPYRCAAVFSFDLDADQGWRRKAESNPEWDRPMVRTRGTFGPEVGVPRILDLFEEFDQQCTFFVPGKVAEEWPEVIKDIHGAGHEIGHHGYTHAYPATIGSEEEVAEFDQAMEVFDELLGERPVGYRCPGFDLSERTLDLIGSREILYDSSFIDNDAPYIRDTDGGKLVEIPVDWSLDDYTYFGFNMYPPVEPLSGITPTDEVFDSWRREFDGLRARSRCFTLTMHPQLSGRAGRVDALADLLEHIVETDDTWVTRARDVAAHWLETHA
ncbi:MAG: polysaccharide deacetylase [Salinirussus sp.]